MLECAISPFDVSARSPACFAAMQLSDRVVTLLPSPREGADADTVRDVMGASAVFHQFLETWRWTRPLWRVGVLGSDIDGDSLIEDIDAVCTRIDQDREFAPLRRLVHASVLDDSRSYLEVLCRDLMKGGGDPRTTIPVSAAVERFAGRNAVSIFRVSLPSLAGRIEERSVRPVARFLAPILIHATGDQVMRVRDELEPERTDVVAEVQHLIDAARRSDGADDARLRAALTAYEARFRHELNDLIAPDDEDGPKAHAIQAGFSIGRLAPDTILSAASAAARSIRQNAAARRPAQTSTSSVDLAAPSTISLTVRATKIQVSA